MNTDRNPDLALINAKGKLASVIGSNQLEADILTIIGSYGDISSLQHEKSLLHDICKRVENAQSVKLSSDEKMALVVKILIRLFPLLNNEKDLNVIKSDIEWLYSRGYVKQVSLFKKLKIGVIGFLKKKV
jgi:hypothetical protein